MGNFVEPEVKITKNGSSVSDQSRFNTGDTLKITIPKDDIWGKSTIELFDPNQNRRYLGRRNGDHNAEIILPATQLFGKWECKIEIDNLEGGSISISQSLKVVSSTKTELPKPTTAMDEDYLPEAEEDTGEALLPEPEEDAGEDLLPEAEDEDDIDLEPQPVDMNELSYKEQRDKLESIATEEDLRLIQPVELSDDDRNDLEIPLAEMDEIKKKHQSSLKSADLMYIYHILEENPVELKRITDAPVEEVKIWLQRSYLILDNKDHGLRREYRKIRSEYFEYQRQLETLMESSLAQDPISVLVGVNKASIDRLIQEDIETVGQLLQIPLVELINLEVDPEKPLLPKLWIANAKSYLGIK